MALDKKGRHFGMRARVEESMIRQRACRTIAAQQIDIVMGRVVMPLAGRGWSFRPAGKICVIVTRFSGSQDTGLVELETRHRSCVNGLVLAALPCIPG
jgi:hypothetical protein